jgi:hypothetical protein
MNEQAGSQRTFTQELLTREGIDKVRNRDGASFTGFALSNSESL